MAGLKSVHLALHLATRRSEQALAGLTVLRHRHSAAQGQLLQLQNYADETQARWLAAASNSVSPELLRGHYQFMDRLGQAMLLQQGLLAQIDTKLAGARDIWLAAQARLAALQQVLQNKQADLRTAQGRLEQKQMDELAATRFRQNTQTNLFEPG